MEMTEEDKRIQQELSKRISAHKLAVVTAHLQQQYLEAEQNSVIKLPEVIAEKNAKRFSAQLTAEYLMAGIIEDEYNKAWYYLSEQLP